MKSEFLCRKRKLEELWKAELMKHLEPTNSPESPSYVQKNSSRAL
jgi:hypothetical protein